MPTPTMFVRMRASANHAALPDVRCDLVWVGEKLFLSGPQTRMQSNFPGQHIALASFEPLIASAWLNMPLHEITDHTVLFEDLKPRLAGPLSDAFSRGSIQSVWGAVMGIPGWTPDKRLGVAMTRMREGASVALAAQDVLLTPRHLVRLFHHQLGLRPKEFSRIIRFRRAVIQIKRGATIADASAAAGFTDQPHFTREVNKFTGFSPTLLIPRVANVQDGIGGSPVD